MTGIPINLNNRLHSSLCSLVTLTVRQEKRSRSSAVPVSFASSPSFASTRFSKRFESYMGGVVSIKGVSEGGGGGRTYDTCFEFGWFAVEYVGEFDTIFDDSDGTVEEAHQVASRSISASLAVPFLKRCMHLVVSPALLVNISPSFCRTAIRNW